MIRTLFSDGIYPIQRGFAYCRVSTSDQMTTNQSLEISLAGFAIESHRLIEEHISGSVAAKARPRFIKLISLKLLIDVTIMVTYTIIMRIIAKSRLKEYWETPGNEKSQPYLNEWYHFCSKQRWGTPQDIKNMLRNVSFVVNDRVVFNVKGNEYRIICAMDYPREAMFIKFVGTHKEYDRVKAGEVE